MKIKVNENRKVYTFEKVGTQNENNITELQIEVPENYQEYNKKIVFTTADGTIWDIVEDNTYKLTKAITKYKSVKFYIWLTKENEDFRSEEKTLIFNNNTDVEKELEQEEINGINKILTKVEMIEEKIETIETKGYDDTEIKESIKELDLKKIDKEEVLTNLEIEEILKL